ncbi:MAG: inorganic phosphate transporter, partial [Ignavibacteriaceae bacterium]|nr:inorganic phosphate transporter [Ignavibacteriaceae bacterium]
GGTAIAFGIITYGHNVMKTVGTDLYKISPITGFAVVFAEFLVLTLFTSQSLETFLLQNNLPSIPLVPLSATQSFIGAVIGVGLAKDPQSINFKVFGKISLGWVIAPLTAGVLSFVLLFFVQNVFEQKIIHQVPHQITQSIITKLNDEGVDTTPISDMVGIRYNNKKVFRNELMDRKEYQNQELFSIFNYAMIDSFKIDSTIINEKIDFEKFNSDEITELKRLHGKAFSHKTDFEKYMTDNLSHWFSNGDRLHDKILKEKFQFIEDIFRVDQEEVDKKKRPNKTLNK